MNLRPGRLDIIASGRRCGKTALMALINFGVDIYANESEDQSLCARCGKNKATVYDNGGDICQECYNAEMR